MVESEQLVMPFGKIMGRHSSLALQLVRRETGKE
jgi:hypothetical protein